LDKPTLLQKPFESLQYHIILENMRLNIATLVLTTIFSMAKNGNASWLRGYQQDYSVEDSHTIGPDNMHSDNEIEGDYDMSWQTETDYDDDYILTTPPPSAELESENEYEDTFAPSLAIEGSDAPTFTPSDEPTIIIPSDEPTTTPTDETTIALSDYDTIPLTVVDYIPFVPSDPPSSVLLDPRSDEYSDPPSDIATIKPSDEPTITSSDFDTILPTSENIPFVP
jgi:hypothetical protein